MSNNIGILGGTFDPPHIGHLIIAEQAYEQLHLEKVWVMPTGCPAYKDRDDISAKDIRGEMVKLSIEDNPHFEYSDIEMKREGVIYTYDTLKQLHEAYPEKHFYFIVGGDSIYNIETWHNPAGIFSLCTIAVTCRDNIISDKLAAITKKLEQKYDADIVMLNIPAIDLSSSNLREMRKNGESIRYYVTDKTYEYISKNNLYI